MDTLDGVLQRLADNTVCVFALVKVCQKESSRDAVGESTGLRRTRIGVVPKASHISAERRHAALPQAQFVAVLALGGVVQKNESLLEFLNGRLPILAGNKTQAGPDANGLGGRLRR